MKQRVCAGVDCVHVIFPFCFDELHSFKFLLYMRVFCCYIFDEPNHDVCKLRVRDSKNIKNNKKFDY